MDMQSILFVQGAGRMHEPGGSGQLAAYLASELGDGYQVIAPKMPDASNPRYEPWRAQIERELEAIDDDVIIVGHSFGGSVVLKYFAEGTYDRPVRGLFLVSVPNWGPDGWNYDEYAVPSNVGSQLPTSHVFLYHSHDDPEVPFGHLSYYQEHIPTATARAVVGSEHSFLQGLPVLLDDIRSLSR